MNISHYSLFIFDADGTLRRCTVPGQPCPNRAGEWELIPGVRERLKAIDWTQKGLGIASNQGGVALGHISNATAYQLLADLVVQATDFWPPTGTIAICPHAPDAGCACRKPKPEMLHHLSSKWVIPLSRTLFVGDQESDRIAAEAAGCAFAWAWDFFGKTREEWTALISGGVR